MASCLHIADHVRVPGQGSKIYKDECVQCYDDLTDEKGLNVCLTCFEGRCAGAENHSYRHWQRHGHPLHLNVRRLFLRDRAEETKSATVTEVAIGKDGVRTGMNLNKYEDLYTVSCLACSATIDYEADPLLKQAAEKIIEASSETNKQVDHSWKQQIIPCEHVLTLQQVAAAPKLAAKEMANCGMCHLKENLWLCLTCGHLGCGREHFEFGSSVNLGGNEHAVKHHEATGHPLVVKTGTITADGQADVWCYACFMGNGNDVKDPELAAHLGHFGIDISTRSKTEKSIAELTLEQNLKLTFFSSREHGKVMQSLAGPGLTGINNIGNSCYMASVLQCLFATPSFQSRYGGKSAEEHAASCVKPPADCWHCQLHKLATGLYCGRYTVDKQEYLQYRDVTARDADMPDTGEADKGKEAGASNAAEEEKEQRGIAPRMFKNLVCKGHYDFEGMQQQDAYEFYQYFVKKAQQNERNEGEGKDPTAPFVATVEEKIQCTTCNGVRYRNVKQTEVTVIIPLERAQPPLDAVEGESKEDASKREKNSVVDFLDCAKEFRLPELVEGFRCPKCQQTTSIKKQKGVFCYPDTLMVNVPRFKVVGWTREVHKVHVSLNVPNVIRLDVMTAPEHGDEELLGEEDKAVAPQVAVNQEHVEQLTALGFEHDMCEYALEMTNHSGAEMAAGWLFENGTDPAVVAKVKERSAPKAPATGTVPLDLIDSLTMMGFTDAQARLGLSKTDCDIERAIDWIYSHPDEVAAANSGGGPAAAEAPKEEEKQERESGPVVYELAGFVQHRGTNVGSGHYVAYLRKGTQWVQFNDSKVTESIDPPVGQGSLYFFQRRHNNNL